MSLTDDILMHYGMPRRSGRYPWGSGDNPYQHSGDFLSRVEELKKSNFTFTDKDGKTYTGEVAIAKSMGLSTTQFRTQMSLAKNERRSADVATAKALRAKGYSLNEIADKMGFANDSSVRSLLNESSEARMNQAKQTAEFLKKQISEKGMIDVGTGVERELGISKEKMNQALYILEMEGYPIYVGGVPQVTNPGKQTNIKVLCPPGTEHKEIYNFENVHSVRDYVSHDDGETFDKFVYPKSMDSSRLKIRYAEDGGIQKDGVIEIRRGVDDLSLGDSHYAQVRILVDGNRYLKGIGKFVGGIVGGFMSGVSSQFPQIGSDLSGFMTNVQPFLDGAASIDPAMLDGVKALAETILILTAANILDGLTSWFTGGSSLSGFAEEMVPFGKAMKQFSDEISGIDGEAVSNAAIAGKTLAEMADTLPNTGGVVGFFAGENDMNAFGEQLIPFGRAMRNFANEVAGIDASVITEAATAGKALAEMASTVPNSGGVVGFFAGENDMDDFGEQLVPFGRAMKNFSDAVSGLKADVIQNSVTAGQALLELANTVPNTGGVVSWFTGDNDLETFGEQLVPFGTAMKNYSLAVTGLDASVVTNSANAAKALVELSNNLPNSGGIVSWFTGDNDIASFGEQLVSFGQSFAAYYNSVSGVDVTKLSGVVVEFRNLVDLANGIKSVDTSGMSTFAQNLTNLGNAGIDGFINAFTNANSRVSTAANTMVTTFINAAKAQQGNLTSTFTTMINGIVTTFTSKYSQFTIMGQTMMTNFISGIRTGDASARSAFVTIVSGCLIAIRNKFYEFNTVGQTTMTNLIAGIRTKNQLAKDAFVQIINSCLTAIRNKYTDFYNAGKYLVEGFAKGIDEYTWYAEARARAMARAAAQAAEAELDINSPSKVGYRIGGFFGMGFVNSLIDYTDKSYDAGASVAKSAKEGLRNAVSKIGDFIENGIDSQPTIRPLLDLSDVTEGADRLSALLSRNQAMKISAGMDREGGSVVQNGGTTPTAGNNYNFTQNNYSPKALSRIDIYRQTKNQFSALKGLVET